MLRTIFKILFVLIVLAALAFAGLHTYRGFVERRDAEERAASPQGQLPETAAPLSYDLHLHVDPSDSRFSGTSRIEIEILQATDTLWIHGKNFEKTSATLTTTDDTALPIDYYEMGHSGVVRLALGKTVQAQQATLEIRYEAPFPESPEGLFRVVDGDEQYAFTDFEPMKARRAFPGFDEPRFKVPFDLSLDIRQEHRGMANSPLVSEEPLDNRFKRLRFATSKPLPTYLVSFAAGDFDVVEWEPVPPNDVRANPLPLRGVARKGKGPEMTYALANTAPIVAALEEYFGLPYPYKKLDLVAVPEFLAGAMENPGLITYQESLLLLGDDPPLASRRTYGEVHAHELAHMWHGNLVTMPWWDDIWLNEAFATWMGYKIADRWDPNAQLERSIIRRSHRVMRDDSYLSARQIREPITSNDDIVNAFDSITYDKGGAVLNMFESYLGREVFRDGVRKHIERFPYGHAGSADFIASLAQASDQPGIDTAFASFLEQTGAPNLALDWSCGDGMVTIEISQSRYLPLGSEIEGEQIWQIPICLRLVDGKKDLEPCFLLEAPRTELEVEADTCPTAIVPNAGGAGYYRWSLAENRWRELLDHVDLLPAAERYSLVDNLAAGFRAGRIPAELLLEAVPLYAAMDEWDLVTAPLNTIELILDNLVDDDTRSELSEYLNSNYLPVLDRIGLLPPAPATEDNAGASRSEADLASDSLLRRNLVELLALTTQAPQLRTQLQAMGEKAIGYGGDGDGDGKLDLEAVPDDLIVSALAVALQTHGMPYYEALFEHFKESDEPLFRRRALQAMARTTDPEAAEKTRQLLASFSVSFGEKATLFGSLLGEPESQRALYEWIKGFWGKARLVLPEQAMVYLAGAANGFCSMEDHADVEAFFEPRMAEIVGGPRRLAIVLERIRICSALVEHQRKITIPAPPPSLGGSVMG